MAAAIIGLAAVSSLCSTSISFQPPPLIPHRAPQPILFAGGEFGAHSGTAAFGAAFAASVVATALMHPVDTLKTREQALPVDGVDTSLWRGVSANVLKEAPDAAVFLALSEQVSQSLAYHSPFFASHLTMTLLLAGAFGDAVGSVFRLPAEIVCKRLQTEVQDVCWISTLKETPPEHWMSAWHAILYRDVPMGGLQIAAYRQAQLHIAPFFAAIGAAVPDSASDCLAGLLAGACAAAFTTPLDVLVTHAATARPKEDGTPPPGPLQIGAQLVKEQGIFSLTRGLGPRTVYCTRSLPLPACTTAHLLFIPR